MKQDRPTSNNEERLAKAPMLSLVLSMAAPCVAAQLINLLYSVVDRIFIGHIEGVGTDALAGVGVTGSIIILITAFSAAVGVGGGSLASIAMGRGDREEAARILGNGFSMLVIISLFIALFTYIFMEPVLLMTGASEQTLQYAVEYLSVYLTGTLFVLIALGLNSFITAQGRPGVAMVAVVIGAAINIILDYIFIFELHLGVRGAAYATVISQACSAGWVIRFLISKEATLPLRREYMGLRRKIVLSTLALGTSPFVMMSTEALVGFVLNGGLKEYGDIYISSMSIIQSAILIVSIPLTGFAQGFIPIIAYNYGRGDAERVKSCFKISILIMSIFNFVMLLAMILFPSAVAAIFTADETLIENVRSVMPTFLFGMTLFGMQRTCQNTFIALGEARISIFIAFLRKIFLLIPLAIILPKHIGLMGIYWAESISDATAAILCMIIFYFSFKRALGRLHLREE